MPKGIIVAEGQFEDIVEFATPLELERYAEGVARGSSLYGAGSCQVLTRDDLDAGGLSDEHVALVEQYLPAD